MLISGRVFWSLAAIDHDGADELVSLTKREKKKSVNTNEEKNKKQKQKNQTASENNVRSFKGQGFQNLLSDR